MKSFYLLFIVILFVGVNHATAQDVPALLSYQGRLVDGTNLVNGDVELTIRMFDRPVGGSFPYCEDSGTVTVVDGLYSTYIGDDVWFGSLDNALNQTQVWIEVVVGTNVLSPRERLVAGGFARYAAGLPGDAVYAHNIGAGQIYNYHIWDGEITGTKIDTGTISNANLAGTAVASNVIDWADMPPGLQDGDQDTTYSAAGGLDLMSEIFFIAKNGVSNEHLASDAVASNVIDWADMPPGLQDGDQDTTYSAGTGLNIAGGVISITNSAIGEQQLAKKYRSGSVPVSIPPYRSATDVQIGFSPAFGAMPMVTANLNLGPSPEDLSPAVLIRHTATTGFSARIVHNDFAPSQWTTDIMINTNYHLDYTLTEVSGRPATAQCVYDIDTDEGWLYYTRANDASGSSWPSGIRIGTNTVCLFCDLVMVNGRPAVCYATGDGGLMYARADNSTGSSWGTPQSITDTIYHYRDISMAIVNGNPAIAYIGSDRDLRYVRASDANGSSWNTPTVVYSATNVLPTLMVADGRPAIACVYITPLENRYAYYHRADDADGTAWSTHHQVDSSRDIYGCTAAIVNGRPAVIREDNNAEALVYTRSTTAAGSFSDSAQVRVLPINETYGRTAHDLCIINGNPVLCVADYYSHQILYVSALDEDGDSWETSKVIANVEGSPSFAAMAAVNGTPMIAYGNNLHVDLQDLQLAVSSASTGTLNWIAVEP